VTRPSPLIHHEPVEPAEALDNARDAAALWSVGYVRAAELVDAACDLLVTGHDGPTLAMLAGVHVRHADQEVPDLLEAACTKSVWTSTRQAAARAQRPRSRHSLGVFWPDAWSPAP
jgi:hypothetical protein